MSIFDTLYGFGQGIINLIPGQGNPSTPPPQATLPQSSVPNLPPPVQTQQLQPVPSTAPTTIYSPWGEQRQIEVQQAKVVYDPIGGGYGGYQVPARSEPGFTRQYGFITTGGGPGSLQSGMVSTKPLTPVVYTQRGTELAPSARPELAAMVLAAPERFSRLGAEAYGGYVLPLDDRRLFPTSQMGRYPVASGNLANLVDPYGVNKPKTQFTEIPWQIGDYQRAQTFQDVTKMTPTGGLPTLDIIGTPKVMNVPRGGFMGASAGTIGEGGLPTPFRVPSTQTTIEKPSGIFAFFQQPIKTEVITRATPEGRLTTTTITPMPSGYELLETGASKKFYSVLPPAMGTMLKWGEMQIEKVGLQPSDISLGALVTRSETVLFKSTVVPIAGIAYGEMKGISEHPVRTVAAVGTGIVLGAGFKAIEYGGAIGAEAAATQYPTATAALTKLNVDILPKVLVGSYGVDVAIRSTERMQALPSRTAVRFGEILGTETMPMAVGFGIGYNAPGTLYQAARTQEIDIKAFQQETGQGAFGYAKASTQEAIDIGTRPARALQIDYRAFQQETGGGIADYLGGKISRPVRLAEIGAKSYFQELTAPKLPEVSAVDTIGWKVAEKPATRAAWETRTWKPTQETGGKTIPEITTEVYSGGQTSLMRMRTTAPAELTQIQQGMPEFVNPAPSLIPRGKIIFEEETAYQWWGLGGVLKSPQITRIQNLAFIPEVGQRAAQEQTKSFRLSLIPVTIQSQEVIQRQKGELVTTQSQRSEQQLISDILPRSMQITRQGAISIRESTQEQRTRQEQTIRPITDQRFIFDTRPLTIPKTTIGIGLPGPLFGGSAFGGYFKGKRQHLEFFKVGRGISDMDILGSSKISRIKPIRIKKIKF